MTRCKHCSYNYQLKSSVYNQTGQGYEVQLASYNAMTNHLRRILLAKSVVDSGKVNKRVSRNCNNNRRPKTTSSFQNLSDRLAYDTKRHPHEVARMSWSACDHICGAKYNRSLKGIRSNSTDSSEDSSLRDHQRSIKSYRDKFQAGSSARKTSPRPPPLCQRAQVLNGGKKKHRAEFEEPVDESGESDDFGDLKSSGKSKSKSKRLEKERNCLKSFRGVIPRVKSSLEISCPRTPEFIDSTININCVEFGSDISMYVKFVYDITKEVMDRGYYSDNEIERVFKKHLERNLGRLNKNKMLREINSLKKALNMSYDSDYDEDEDDNAGIATCRFPPSSEHSFEKLRCSLSNFDKKAERIVENEKEMGSSGENYLEKAESKVETMNSGEIIVTKEDILTTLLEMNLNPKRAQEICKSLENRSKEVMKYELPGFRSSEVTSKLNKEDCKNSQLSRSEKKIRSAVESMAGVDSEKLEQRDWSGKSAREKTEGINRNASIENSAEESEKEKGEEGISTSHSRSGKKSPSPGREKDSNKLEEGCDYLSNGKANDSDIPEALEDMNKELKEDDAGLDIDKMPCPPSSLKLQDVTRCLKKKKDN